MLVMSEREFGLLGQMPQRIRHAWMLDGEDDRQVYILTWRRQKFALVLYAIDIEGDPDPVLIQQWVAREQLRPA